MKLAHIIVPLLFSSAHAANWWWGGGNGGANGGGSSGGGGGSVPVGTLDVNEAKTVIFMREEEKMARDVYLKLYEIWNEAIFSNIADAEQAHMDRMLAMIQRYGLTDPVVNDDVGVFQDTGLRKMYNDLVAQGSLSLKDALMAGGLIEETDIEDLEDAISETDELMLDRVYGNLKRASGNHLRGFVRELAFQGETYQAQHLTPAEVNAIILN